MDMEQKMWTASFRCSCGKMEAAAQDRDKWSVAYMLDWGRQSIIPLK